MTTPMTLLMNNAQYHTKWLKMNHLMHTQVLKCTDKFWYDASAKMFAENTISLIKLLVYNKCSISCTNI